MPSFSLLSCIISLSAICTPLFLSLQLHAGGGPEAVVVVVNANSPESLEVANTYAKLRQIPDLNIIYLDNVPSENTISLIDFRQRILLPIFAQIKQRGLDTHIDYITYSCGFPTRVNFDAALVKKLRWVANPQASITGLTYLFQLSLSSEESFLNPQSNFYYRQTRIGDHDTATFTATPAAELKDVYDFFTEKNAREQKRKRDKTEESDEDRQWEANAWKTALTTLDALSKKYENDTSLLYNLACAQAMTGDSSAAVQTLSQCIDKGYADWQHCRQDADLISLRQIPEFIAIIERMQSIPVHVADSIGFSSRFGFNQKGDVVAADQGMHYVICTMLGYTGDRGNTVPEIISYLSSAAAADYSQPKGTIYFPLNNDIRSTTREWAVRSAVSSIQALGIQAEILEGKVPLEKTDVMGAHVGTPFFDWAQSQSRILPGAICEHLTSWGAEFDRDGQTKISTWLRAGAAGSSGTVSEPYALKFKFPNAFIQLHYARGCSLGEAFYQSVQSPYELLILGDALCQPWALSHTFTFSGLPASNHITETTHLDIQSDTEFSNASAYLNGRLCAVAAPGKALTLSTKSLVPGYYQLRVALQYQNTLQTRTGLEQELRVGVQNYITDCSISETNGTIEVKFSCVDTENFAAFGLMLNERIIGRHVQQSGSLSVQRSVTGRGPIRLRPVLLNSDQEPYFFGQALILN